MPWALDPAALVAAREEAAAQAVEFGGNTAYQRLGRAHRWLDEDEPARSAFAEAAADLQALIERGRGKNASTFQKLGHLLRLAGDADSARAAFGQALTMDPQPPREAELRYMLGEDPGPHDGFKAQTMRALRTGDASAIAAAREAIVRALRAERSAPDYTASELTLYDLLEETFRVEAELSGAPVPDHRAMLERAGLLAAGAPAAPPAIEPPPVGRWTAGDAVLEQGEEGPIVATLGGDLWLEFVQSFDEYEVRTWRGHSQLNVTGMHPTFGEAVEAAADSLRSHADEDAVARLTALLREYGQPH
jgi:tetratricopeptide (TPR) repeat protein